VPDAFSIFVSKGTHTLSVNVFPSMTVQLLRKMLMQTHILAEVDRSVRGAQHIAIDQQVNKRYYVLYCSHAPTPLVTPSCSSLLAVIFSG
jgi:hypothetical protein